MKHHFKRLLPAEWNERIMTLADFDRYCQVGGVLVCEVALDCTGRYLTIEGLPVILLNKKLRGIKKTRVAFHELGHHWLHVPGADASCNGDQKREAEARVIEACALIPQPLLLNSPLWEIGEMYGYPKDLLRFRHRVYQYYEL